MRKHSICHIHTLDHPNVLLLLEYLVKYKDIFTGQKIATITKIPGEEDVYIQAKRILELLNYKVFLVSNNEFRESSHFVETSLPELLKTAQDEDVVHYCHSKGVTYHPETETGKAATRWAVELLEGTLNNEFPFEDKKYKTFGVLRLGKPGYLANKLGENYSYVGTMFWLRVDRLRKPFKVTSKFWLEALPGLISTIDESFSLPPVITSMENPYELATWLKKE